MGFWRRFFSTWGTADQPPAARTAGALATRASSPHPPRSDPRARASGNHRPSSDPRRAPRGRSAGPARRDRREGRCRRSKLHRPPHVAGHPPPSRRRLPAHPIRPPRRQTAAGADREQARPKWIKSSGKFYLIVRPLPRALRRRVALASASFQCGGRRSITRSTPSKRKKFRSRVSPCPSRWASQQGESDRQPGLSADAENPESTETYRPGGGEAEMPADLDTYAAGRKAEKSIAAAIAWFARHQEPDGRWSYSQFAQHCGATLQPAGRVAGRRRGNRNGTAAVLRSRTHPDYLGSLLQNLPVAIAVWLLEHQPASGKLSGGVEGRMYSHAIATLALCGNYGLTRRSRSAGAGAGARHSLHRRRPEQGHRRLEL